VAIVGETIVPSAADTARFWALVDRGGPEDCWPWLGTPNRYGYGRFTLNERGARRQIAAHRVAYTLLVGEVPHGLTLDHLCRHTMCVNPAHMEPVTNSENMRRSNASRLAARGGLCMAGLHPMADAYVSPNGVRSCRECRIRNSAEWKRRQVEQGLVEHGTSTAYTYGCRCAACRAAQTAYMRAYRAARR
jgi:HNH endonuclease